MPHPEIQKDLLSQLLYEAESYRKFEDIERLVEMGGDLSVIPIQPLFVSLQSTTKDQIAAILPKLSEEQRQALRDIDLWHRDQFDKEAAFFWLDVFGRCPDENVVNEYIQSEDFLLTLKNQFTIATFEPEEPEYPEGNNYFVTEDNQLLIEYPEDFQDVNLLKELIRRLYSELGVENAYAFLFKMVVDSYQMMEEEIYEAKIERLRDFGFVDYYEALAYKSSFTTKSQIDDFIKQKRGFTGELDALSVNQGLHATSLVPYQSGMDDLKKALDKITDQKRQKFLHFNFVRLVNARMTLEDALKNGSMAMGKVGLETKQSLELGFDYVSLQHTKGELFDTFDFVDLYRIGHGLIDLSRKKLKTALAASPFEQDEVSYFLGLYWNSFLENSMDETAKYKFDGSSKAREVHDFDSFQLWNSAIETFSKAMPFVLTFYKQFAKMKSEGLLNDQFYLNYEVDNIDFESIMISSFINYSAGHYQESTSGKMGVTVSELKNFYHRFFKKNGEEYLILGESDSTLKDLMLKFMTQFGLSEIPRFETYLYQILVEQLNGYEIDKMDEEEFKHVGGPILLNLTSN